MEVRVSFTPRPLYPKERAPVTHWIRDWVGPRALLEAVVKKKIPSPLTRGIVVALTTS